MTKIADVSSASNDSIGGSTPFDNLLRMINKQPKTTIGEKKTHLQYEQVKSLAARNTDTLSNMKAIYNVVDITGHTNGSSKSNFASALSRLLVVNEIQLEESEKPVIPLKKNTPKVKSEKANNADISVSDSLLEKGTKKSPAPKHVEIQAVEDRDEFIALDADDDIEFLDTMIETDDVHAALQSDLFNEIFQNDELYDQDELGFAPSPASSDPSTFGFGDSFFKSGYYAGSSETSPTDRFSDIFKHASGGQYHQYSPFGAGPESFFESNEVESGFEGSLFKSKEEDGFNGALPPNRNVFQHAEPIALGGAPLLAKVLSEDVIPKNETKKEFREPEPITPGGAPLSAKASPNDVITKKETISAFREAEPITVGGAPLSVKTSPEDVIPKNEGIKKPGSTKVSLDDLLAAKSKVTSSAVASPSSSSFSPNEFPSLDAFPVLGATDGFPALEKSKTTKDTRAADEAYEAHKRLLEHQKKAKREAVLLQREKEAKILELQVAQERSTRAAPRKASLPGPVLLEKSARKGPPRKASLPEPVAVSPPEPVAVSKKTVNQSEADAEVRSSKQSAVSTPVVSSKPSKVEELLFQAEECISNRMFKEALRVVDQVRKIEDTPKLFRIRCFCLVQLGRIKEAKLLAQSQPDSQAYVLLEIGKYLVSDRGRIEDAREVFGQAKSIDPTCIESVKEYKTVDWVRVRLGLIQEKITQDNLDEARKIIKAVKKKCDNCVELVALEESFDEVNAQVRFDKFKKDLRLMTTNANMSFSAMKLLGEKSAKLKEKMTGSIDPTEVLLMGLASLRMGELDTGINQIKEASKMDPDNSEISQLCLKVIKSRKALETLSVTIRMQTTPEKVKSVVDSASQDPDFPHFKYLLLVEHARQLIEIGQPKDVDNILTSAIKINCTLGDAYICQMEFYLELGDEVSLKRAIHCSAVAESRIQNKSAIRELVSLRRTCMELLSGIMQARKDREEEDRRKNLARENRWKPQSSFPFDPQGFYYDSESGDDDGYYDFEDEDEDYEHAGFFQSARPEVNYYEVLEISQTADDSGIKDAYRSLARQFHPDKNVAKTERERHSASSQMKLVNEAYEVLRDPERRDHHDRALRGECGEEDFGPSEMDAMFSHFFNMFARQHGFRPHY